MQRFAYARRGAGLRSHVTMLCAMLMADVVTVIVIGIWVPGFWKAVVFGLGVAFVGVALWFLTWPLRTAHGLDDTALYLQLGRFRAVVPRRLVAGAALCKATIPRGIAVPTMGGAFHEDGDTLYLLADKRGLVELHLAEPVTVRVRKLGTVGVSRVVLSLDEPAALVAALGAGTGAAVGPAATQVALSPAPLVAEGAAVQLDHLTRRYGDFVAVDGLNVQVHPGEVLAFLGANGAGKTTTIRMLTGLLRPTSGRVLVGGQDLWTAGPALRRQIGYVPDVPLLYEGLTAREFLWLMAGLYGLAPAEGRRRAAELLAMLKLERWGDHLIRHFSLGMKRKMAIAAALVHRPRILLLDEVTNGLDPRAAREIKDLIAAAARGGAAVFLTTHLLDVAQELAHRIAIIDQGRLRAVGTLEELRALAGRPGAGLEELFLALTGLEVSA